MNKKYELTEDTIVYRGKELHRIKALRDFGDVKKGSLGGFIESEDNLSHEGDCWIYDDSFAYANSKVCDTSSIHGYSKVCDCELYDNSEINGDSKINNVIMHNNSKIIDSTLYGDIQLFGHSMIHKSTLEIEHIILNCFNGFINNTFYNNYNIYINASSSIYNNYNYLNNIPKIYPNIFES